MKKRDEYVKLSLGIFCSVCILTMVFLISNGNPDDLMTSIERLDKSVNVVFTKDPERNQIMVEPYDIVYFENITIDGTKVNDYEITFDNKSGKVDYTFYIENKSNHDAVLQDYKLPHPVCQGFQEDCEKVLLGLDYRIKYEYGADLKSGDVFKAQEKTKVILTIKYDANENNLPSASTDISNLGFNLSFTAK